MTEAAAEDVALEMLLEAPLVREASSELKLEAAEPVALASEELSCEDREAMFELMEEDAEDAAEETEDEMLLALEAAELLADEAPDAAEELAEEITLETELEIELAVAPSSVVVVVSWAW